MYELVLTSAYPVFALSNNKLVYLSDNELRRIPKASTRIPNTARDFDTREKAQHYATEQKSNAHLLVNAESP
jgi:hypothetical protein